MVQLSMARMPTLVATMSCYPATVLGWSLPARVDIGVVLVVY